MILKPHTKLNEYRSSETGFTKILSILSHQRRNNKTRVNKTYTRLFSIRYLPELPDEEKISTTSFLQHVLTCLFINELAIVNGNKTSSRKIRVCEHTGPYKISIQLLLFVSFVKIVIIIVISCRLGEIIIQSHLRNTMITITMRDTKSIALY
jgi:hypothetical protein